MKIQQNQKKSVKITCFLTIEDMQKIVDANEKLVNEMKDGSK
jgi:hypothetical protein